MGVLILASPNKGNRSTKEIPPPLVAWFAPKIEKQFQEVKIKYISYTRNSELILEN